MAALMMLFGLYSFFSMSKDIFPAVNMPEVNLVWYYPGMSAPEIEKRIVNITERATSQTVTGVDHIGVQFVRRHRAHQDLFQREREHRPCHLAALLGY